MIVTRSAHAAAPSVMSEHRFPGNPIDIEPDRMRGTLRFDLDPSRPAVEHKRHADERLQPIASRSFGWRDVASRDLNPRFPGPTRGVFIAESAEPKPEAATKIAERPLGKASRPAEPRPQQQDFHRSAVRALDLALRGRDTIVVRIEKWLRLD
jgi:hypothetical protein